MVRFWIVGAILCAIGFVALLPLLPAVPALMAGTCLSASSCSGSRARDGRLSARCAARGGRGRSRYDRDRAARRRDSVPTSTLGDWDEALLDGVDARRQEPRRARRGAAGRRRASARHPCDLARSSSARGCCPTRSSASPARTARRRRPRCSARSSTRRAGRSRWRQHRPAADVARRRHRRRTPGSCASCRRSSSRTSRRCDRAWRCCSTSSPTTSTGTARSTPTRTPSCACSRTRRRTTWPSCRAASAPVPGAGRRVEFAARRPAARRAADPGRAQPRERRRRDRRGARDRRSPTTRSREALRHLPRRRAPDRDRWPSVDGVLYVNDSKATNVAAALRALASFPERRLHVILGGRGKGESYAPLADALGRRRPRVPDRRGGRRDRRGARRPRRRLSSARRPRARRAEPRRRRQCPATSSCSRPPAPASTSSRASSSAARSSAGWWRSLAAVMRGQLEQRVLVLVTLGLVAFGLVMVFSATSASAAIGEGDPMYFLVKQGALRARRRRAAGRRCRGSTTTGCGCSRRSLLVAALVLLRRRARARPADQRRSALVPARPGELPAVGAREAGALHLGRRRVSRGGRRRRRSGELHEAGRAGSWRSSAR